MARPKRMKAVEITQVVNYVATKNPKLLIEVEGKKFFVEIACCSVEIQRDIETKRMLYPRAVTIIRPTPFNITITGVVVEDSPKKSVRVGV